MYIRCPEGPLCYNPQTSDTMAYFILDRGVFQILLARGSCTPVRVCSKIAHSQFRSSLPSRQRRQRRRRRTFENVRGAQRDDGNGAATPPPSPRSCFQGSPSLFPFLFLSFFLSFFFFNRRSTTRPSNEIPSKGISNLSHEDKPLLRSSWNIDRYVSKTDRTGLVAFLCIDFFKHLIKIYMYIYIQCYVLFLCFEIFFFFGKCSANVQSLFRSNLLYAENIFVFDSQH